MDMEGTAGDPAYRRPSERKSLHARIVRDLGLRILSGELQPGDRLPNEASLCGTYEAS